MMQRNGQEFKTLKATEETKQCLDSIVARFPELKELSCFTDIVRRVRSACNKHNGVEVMNASMFGLVNK
jgi:hypothetical protein